MALPDQMAEGLMPEGTICLTFDDGPGATIGSGPGPRTVALAEYLASQHIPATFFMCGNQVEQFPEIPQIVRSLGHVIGNHTFDHFHLPSLSDDEIRDQLRRALDQLVSLGVPTPMPFRPPYGAWDERTAAAVNADADLADAHSGVYGWDLGAVDWQYWEVGAPNGIPVANHCAQQAVEVGSGVVLMHDSTASQDEPSALMRAGNRALETMARLVPMLQAEGFVFRPLPSTD